jgi:hypothetical protein
MRDPSERTALDAVSDSGEEGVIGPETLAIFQSGHYCTELSHFLLSSPMVFSRVCVLSMLGVDRFVT